MNTKKTPLSYHVVGSGMLARAFSCVTEGEKSSICVYAAGVSNSGCSNGLEFDRERKRLEQALKCYKDAAPFVYFGTCSVYDPEMQKTPYVQHKLAMECLVKQHPRHLIFRLPQVVGRTPNPHTLLNFLYSRIARSERFTVWRNARRNIIDVDDVVSIATRFVTDYSLQNITLNIANPSSYSVLDVVRALENAVGKPALYDLIDRGSIYAIDASESTLVALRVGVTFPDDYLDRVVGKYYGNF